MLLARTCKRNAKIASTDNSPIAVVNTDPQRALDPRGDLITGT